MTSCGALVPDSRLDKLIAVLLVVMRAKLKVPFPVIYEVTSTVVQVPVLIAPDELIKAPTAGALL
jgi:hypothetical protein